MARIRTVKPEFFEHEGLAKCSAHARLFAIGVLTLADSEGRFEWIPMKVHSGVFPWEASIDLEGVAREIEAAGWLRRYRVDGRAYAEVINFRKHQRITGKEAQQKSKCPEYIDNSWGSNGESPGCVPGKHLDAQGTGEQGNREEERQAPPAAAENPTSEKPAVDQIYGFGLDFMKSKGVPEGGARSFLGAMRKEVGNDLDLLDLLITAEQQDVLEPKAWLKGAWKSRKSINGSGDDLGTVKPGEL